MTAPAEPEVIYEAEQATAEVARILTETAVGRVLDQGEES